MNDALMLIELSMNAVLLAFLQAAKADTIISSHRHNDNVTSEMQNIHRKGCMRLPNYLKKIQYVITTKLQ